MDQSAKHWCGKESVDTVLKDRKLYILSVSVHSLEQDF